MLNPFKLLTIYRDLNGFEAVLKEEIPMGAKWTQYLTLAISLAGTLGVPAFATNWLSLHGSIYTGFVAVAILLHAILPSIFSAPSSSATQSAGLGKLGMVLLAIGLASMCARNASAQTPTPTPAPSATPAPTPAPSATPAGFVASSDALAIDVGGSWGAGNLTTESYDFLDYGTTKSNRLFLQGVELTAPNANLSIFGGGLLWQPDISRLLARTNLPTGDFVAFLDANVGDGIPTSGASHVSTIFGGGLKYIMSDSLTWNTLRVEEVFYGSSRYPAISMGLSAYFGGAPK